MKCEPKMSGLAPEKQAARAIVHTLQRISETPEVAWYCGHGTQTYALLTEAHATLSGITMAEAQQNWPPAAQRKYTGEDLRSCPFCGGHYLQMTEDYGDHAVSCGDCQFKGPKADDEEQARAEWNTRSPF
jgi:Lar family restriction alleviation protein